MLINPSGDDKMSAKILEISEIVLDKTLTTVKNLSTSEMTFPTKSKAAAVVLIFKSEDKIDKDFRPVSTISSPSKKCLKPHHF